MTTMLGVRTSRHFKPDQTHFVWGTHTESDNAPARKRVYPYEIIKIIFVVLFAGKMFMPASYAYAYMCQPYSTAT